MMATDNETRDPMRAFSWAGLLEAARQSVLQLFQNGEPLGAEPHPL
jgi:hypothetical protein